MSKTNVQLKTKGSQRRGAQAGADAGTRKNGPKKKLKPNIKKSGGGGMLQDVPLVVKGGDSDASDLELSDEDLQFVEKHSRRLGFLETLDPKELERSIRAQQERQAKKAAEARQKAKAAAEAKGDSDVGDEDVGGDSDDEAGEGRRGHAREGSEEEEEAYERAPRRAKNDPRDTSTAGLPIKTLTGDVVYDKTAAGAADGAAGRRRGGQQAAGQQREAEMEAALAAAAAIQVEGVTITDDLEAALADNKRKAAEEADRRAREQKKKKAAAAKKAEEALLPPALRGLDLPGMDPAQRRAKLQEVMAAAAQKLLASPELSVGELRTLQTLVVEKDSMTSRLALLSLFAVFKDILPGYRIRPPSEKELEVKVSKEVAKLREYEQALLKAYQTYLRSILDAAQCVERGSGTRSHSRVAVRCLCGLLAAHPHFNYTSDILQAVVPLMASPDPETRSLACEAVRTLLAGGEQGGDEAGAGRAALEAVQLVADLVRRRRCVAPAEVVTSLAVLRFRDVSRLKGGEEEEAGGRRRHKGKKAERREAKRRRNEDDVSRAFKEADAGPDRAELARLQSSMLEALFEIYFRVLKHACGLGLAAVAPAPGSGAASDAGPRVPSASASPPWSRARLMSKCPLLHPVLDGLAKYTHLISVEYFNDLLALLTSLLAGPGLPLPDRLRLLATAAALLRGQGEALNVDRRDLYVQLYDTLLQVPVQALLNEDPASLASLLGPLAGTTNGGAATGRNDDHDDDGAAAEGDGDAGYDADIAMAVACEQAAAAAAAVLSPADAAAATTTTGTGGSTAVLLAGVLEALLCEPKLADLQRAAAFVKRMAGAAVQSAPGEAMALWAAVGRMLRRYPKLANLLEYEGEAPTVGGRTYDCFCTDPSEAGALSTTLWEVCLVSGGDLHSHPHPLYHPHLAQAAGSLLALRPAAVAAAAAAGTGGGAIHLTGPLGTPATIRELADAYDSSRGLVRPPPPPPAAAAGGGGCKGKGRQRRGGAAAALAAAALSPEFLEEVARLAEEFGSTTGNGGWDGMELDSESESGSEDGEDEEGADSDAAERGRQGASISGRVAAAAAAGGAGSGSGSGAAAAALRRMFLESRRFHQNKHLRLEKALMVERLKRFHIHLQQRHVQEAAAAAAAAARATVAGGKPGKKARLGAGAEGAMAAVVSTAAANGAGTVVAAGEVVGSQKGRGGQAVKRPHQQHHDRSQQQHKAQAHGGARQPQANGHGSKGAAGRKAKR